MKLFKDLTPDEQNMAIELEKANLLQALATRQVIAADPLVQKYVEDSINMAARRRTPELAPGYIYHFCHMAIDNLVAGLVQSNLYAEPQEVVIHNVVGCAPNRKNLH